MVKDTRTPVEIAAANVAHFMGHGPRLSYEYGTWIEAKDTARGKVLVAGLGVTGSGRMWTAEREDHKELPGYAKAPERDSEPPPRMIVDEWVHNTNGRPGVDISLHHAPPELGAFTALPLRLYREDFLGMCAHFWQLMTKKERAAALQTARKWQEGREGT